MNKVFGIGFHKTGTSTLGASLSKLGYKVCGVRPQLAGPLFRGDLEPVWKLTQKYSAFQDNPWPLLYRELDREYPGSKFILTVREEEEWIRSVVYHFGKKQTEMRRWIYGVGQPKGNEEIYLSKYTAHNHHVMKYFEDRKNDLLVVSWGRGDGWKELCEFLDCPIPNIPFPHKNKANYSLFTKIRDKIKYYF